MKLCPECLTPLNHVKHQIFHCWVCPEGHGTLYPKGELERIVQSISGLGDLEMRIWNDNERYSVVQSPLMNSATNTPLLEIRDKDYMNIMVYGDPVTHDLWLHTGEEEKLVEHIERARQADSVGSYLSVAASEAAKIFSEAEDAKEAAGHTLTALKLLGERILRAMPHISI
ncbi:Zf-TFIIB domain-containing protein [Sulfidibacter corallicola]|uniref:Zf-TFIIB domain-containing protein n=1 Tax=Sulfidibacter corallicola TaxID=2818388 RepID=A0A8A4TVS5_SULCO|nr:zf-TFIIB domain-containing protein [Sulfidibacter corallicola]QTD54039.1 zf-TFIIB domain-containing protein [Sulfidibacter corallicola]